MAPEITITNPLPDENIEPLWLAYAVNEMNTDVEEIPGARHHPRIVEYHQYTTLKATDDETDWCSSFVNFCVAQAGRVGTRSAAARSWEQWGERIDAPKPGAIVVFRRINSNWRGHVGFYYDKTPSGRLLILGGNQSNKVSISSYPISGSTLAVTSYRWPS